MWYSIFKSGTLDLYLNTSEYEFARHYSYLSKQSESELTGYNERNRVDFCLLEVQENLNIFFLNVFADKLKGHWESLISITLYIIYLLPTVMKAKFLPSWFLHSSSGIRLEINNTIACCS